MGDAALTATAKNVAWSLVNHLNQRNEQCNPGAERIARQIACSVRAVREALAALIRSGRLKASAGARDGRRQPPNNYSFVFPSAQLNVQNLHPHSGAHSVQNFPSTVQILHADDAPDSVQNFPSTVQILHADDAPDSVQNFPVRVQNSSFERADFAGEPSKEPESEPSARAREGGENLDAPRAENPNVASDDDALIDDMLAKIASRIGATPTRSWIAGAALSVGSSGELIIAGMSPAAYRWMVSRQSEIANAIAPRSLAIRRPSNVL